MVICFISGGYALYLNETGVNIVDDSASPQATSPQADVAPHGNNPAAGDVAKVASLSDVQTFFENVNTYSANTYSAKVAPTHPIFVEPGFNDTDYHVYNGDYSSYYVHNSLNTTDKYVQCAECGKYSPIGDVTKKLDDNLICKGHNDSCGSNIDDDYFALTYDEVLFIVDHNGYLPESAYTRTAEHLGITIPYSDYIAPYYGMTPDEEVFTELVTEPVTGIEHYSPNDDSLPVIAFDEDFDSNQDSPCDDVNPQYEPVYAIDTINCY